MALKRMIVRVVLCVAALSMGISDTTPHAVVPADQHADQHAALQTVKLRKLHLVRPDLIPYPLAYEIVC